METAVRHRRRRVRKPETREVTCSECGSLFTISRRTYRERRAAAKPFLCAACRQFIVPGNRFASNGDVRERIRCCSRRDHAWWVRRFPDEQLELLVEAVFGPAAVTPERVARRAALVASCQPRPSRRAA